MPRKQKKAKRTRRAPQKGGKRRPTEQQMQAYINQGGAGIFGDINNWLKKTKILSKVAPLIGTAFGAPAIGTSAGGLISQLGYGQRGRGQRGAGPYPIGLSSTSLARF